MRCILVGTTDTAEMMKSTLEKCVAQNWAYRFDASQVEPGEGDAAILMSDESSVAGHALELMKKGFDAAIPGWLSYDAKAILELDAEFKKAGRKLRLLFLDRFSPNIVDVSRELGKGSIGKIGVIDYLKIWPEPNKDALRPISECLDTLTGWFGSPVRAMGFRNSGDGTSCASMTLEFKNGEIANVQAVASAYDGDYTDVYELSGSLGNLAYDSNQARPVCLKASGIERAAKRFLMAGTEVCPIKAAAVYVPKLFESNETGLSSGDREIIDILDKAFNREGGYNG